MKVMTVVLACCAILSSSALAVGQGPVPFKAMMQTAGTPAVANAIPTGDSHQSLAAATTRTHTGPLTPKGKGMIIGGIVLVAAGAVVIAADAAFGSTMGTKGVEGRTAAAYCGGIAAAGTGVTLIVFGGRNRSQ